MLHNNNTQLLTTDQQPINNNNNNGFNSNNITKAADSKKTPRFLTFRHSPNRPNTTCGSKDAVTKDSSVKKPLVTESKISSNSEDLKSSDANVKLPPNMHTMHT